MSIRIMDEVWRLSCASGSELLLLLALADVADEESRKCWPGVPFLAKKTRMSERTVQRLLEKLERAAEIEIERRPHRTNVYQIRAMTGQNGYGDSLTPYGDIAVSPDSSRTLGLSPRRDEIWDTLTELFGDAETESAKSRRGKVRRSLASAGASAHEIRLRAERWPDLFDDATLTESALEKHWGQLGQPIKRRRSKRYGRGVTTEEILDTAAKLEEVGR